MIVARHQPYGPQNIERHTLPIVRYRNLRCTWLCQLKTHSRLISVGIVRVFDQLEHGKPRTSYQFITEQL